MSDAGRRPITRELARLGVQSSYGALPAAIQQEVARTFLNFVGCALGGCHEPAVEAATAVAREEGGHARAAVIGHRFKTNLADAAFINCLSSSVLAFDDTHLATVTHPTGPVAAALLALAQQRPLNGRQFVNALALGIEIECRMSNVLLMPPAQANLSLYITGITGPIGAAAALARALELDEDHATWALGLAAAQGAGTRSTHGSMAAFFVPAHAARCGTQAAQLASKGFTGSEATLEGDKGFVDVYAPGADLDLAVEGFGSRFELMANAYKPYPCGIVIHAAIDACLDLAASLKPGDLIDSVRIAVHPLTMSLTDRPQPTSPIQAQISLQHWAAACLLQRAAGLAQGSQACIDDPAVAALRARVTGIGDAALARDEAVAEVTLADGRTLRSHVPHARGSLARPMTDLELDEKFLAQARTRLADDASRELLRRCRDVAALDDVARGLSGLLD
jgi:2-methylcitrate dehydratase PrpD